jgi:hypothetical protein
MTRPSPPQLFAEMARLAKSLHWSFDSLLDLEHADRRRFLREVEAISDAPGGE